MTDLLERSNSVDALPEVQVDRASEKDMDAIEGVLYSAAVVAARQSNYQLDLTSEQGISMRTQAGEGGASYEVFISPAVVVLEIKPGGEPITTDPAIIFELNKVTSVISEWRKESEEDVFRKVMDSETSADERTKQFISWARHFATLKPEIVKKP